MVIALGWAVVTMIELLGSAKQGVLLTLAAFLSSFSILFLYALFLRRLERP